MKRSDKGLVKSAIISAIIIVLAVIFIVITQYTNSRASIGNTQSKAANDSLNKCLQNCNKAKKRSLITACKAQCINASTGGTITPPPTSTTPPTTPSTTSAPSTPMATWTCSGTEPVAMFTWTGGTPARAEQYEAATNTTKYQYTFSVTVHLLNVTGSSYYGSLVYSGGKYYWTDEPDGNKVSIDRYVISTNLRAGSDLTPRLVFTPGQTFTSYVSGSMQSSPTAPITVPSCP